MTPTFETFGYRKLALAVIRQTVRDLRSQYEPELVDRAIVDFMISSDAGFWLEWLKLEPSRAAALFARKAAG